MNTSDQSLFPMDSAFKRRWAWEYVPIDSANEKSQFKITIGDKTYKWASFLNKVNERIHKLSDSEDKQMGNFFIKSDVDVEEFKSKVMFYLWSEVCKEYEKSGSFFKDKYDNEGVKQRIHDKFRTDLLKVYNAKYDFFKVTPTGDLERFVDAHFEEYLGKMYRSEGKPFIWFAFDKGTTTLSALQTTFCGEATVSQTEIS